MALGGLMSLLKDVAVSPVGQIAGGVMEQKVMASLKETTKKKMFLYILQQLEKQTWS